MMCLSFKFRPNDVELVETVTLLTNTKNGYVKDKKTQFTTRFTTIVDKVYDLVYNDYRR